MYSSEDQKDRHIDYLADRVTNLDLNPLCTDSVIRENRDELFAYLDDGELPIDNNLAERCIRKLTTQRNSMLHFGSDEGVEMAAAYHSIISIVKLHGKSAWHFLGTFFTKIFNGCRDFFSLTPGDIEMAVKPL